MAISKVTSGGIAADIIDGTKIADNAVDTEHLADDAVDSAEIAAGAIDAAHMSANSIDSDSYVDDLNALTSKNWLAGSFARQGGLYCITPRRLTLVEALDADRHIVDF